MGQVKKLNLMESQISKSGNETQKERDRDTGKERERKTLITTGYFVFIITKRGRKPIQKDVKRERELEKESEKEI